MKKISPKELHSIPIPEFERFKYKRILSMIYITFLMAATVMAYKVVKVFGMSQPGSTFIYTFTFFLGNIYAELYGPFYSKKLVWESIFCGYIFATLISVVNYLPSPVYWNKFQEFDLVLGHVMRFTNAGVIGYLLSSFLNIHLLIRWKLKFRGKYFWARSLFASSISEGVATFIAGIFTFFGMLPIKNIIILMACALSFKLIYGFIAVWPASLIAFLLKKNENLQLSKLNV